MTREKKVLANLYHLMALALVAGNSDSSTVFQSEAGFTITYPARYRTDQAESTSIKLYIYLTDSTPVDAVTVSTDDSFTAQATLDTVIEKYADAITTAYKDLKVPLEGPQHVGWSCSISHGLQRRDSCAVR